MATSISFQIVGAAVIEILLFQSLLAGLQQAQGRAIGSAREHSVWLRKNREKDNVVRWSMGKNLDSKDDFPLLPSRSLKQGGFSTNGSNEEIEALMALKQALTAASRSTLSSWSANHTDPCHWKGITCYEHSTRVYSINLRGMGLAGRISPSLGRLQYLRKIDFSNNKLTGEIPSSILNCTDLEYLTLSNNSLTGQIPSQIGTFSQLLMLNLSINFRIQGRIPSSIGNCSLLTDLLLGYTLIKGEIPDTIGQLSNLQRMDLFGALINGSLPRSLGNCSSLKNLKLGNAYLNYYTNNLEPPPDVQFSLSNTLLEGTLPEEMANLKTLRTLGLITTNIHGPLPAWLVNLTLLTVIDIPSSVFSGQIPEFLGSLPLRVLDLSANGFSGVIPRTITNCSNLQFLDLSYLNLGGTIPSDVGLFTKVSHLYIDHNQLVGKMPPSLSNCSSLRILVLGYNPDMDPQPLPQWMGSLVTVEVLFLSNMNLVGNIPSEITRLPRLTSLYLHANQFNGTIPKQLGNCSTLETLLLGLNDFTGGIPSELWELLQLRVLDLEGMNLTGGLSDAVGNLTYLEEIYCHFNLLSGPIPSRISELPSFVIGNFLDNNFDGQIPTAIGNLSSLQRLDLSINLISGSIPASMGNLSNLVQLAISETWVTGVIPAALMSCTQLLYLDLGSNQLVGSIPAEIGNLQALQELSLDNNQLSGALPSSLGSGSSLVIVDVSYNAFRDVFPEEAFRNASSVLISLNLSHNFFSGDLPRSFGRLTVATTLQLSNNKFSGSIPSELGGCLALTALDLSENDFSGTIPQTLASLEHLTFLNLSYNDLKGPLPDTGIFSSENLSATWFLGNPGLCGSRLSKNCSTSGAGSPCEGLSCRAATLAVTICSVAFALLVVAAGTFVVLRFWRAQKGPKVHDGVVMFAEGLHLTEQDLLNIVEEPDNLIATGASSFVYRAKLSDGKVFAVKILARSSSNTAGDDFHSKQLNKAKSHMYREAETLSKLKHRNILKVFGMVSSAKMTGLMVEFMPLGSLDNLLHNVQECPLGWEQRLDIAAGIAQGLIYLHEEVEVPIIHMDLKPANILLDADMTPKLGDFGIARFTNVSSSDGEVTATNLCGTFGYIPPEYANNTRVSTRGDVYSYGVVLLELVTRRRPNTQANDQSDALSSSQGSKDLNPLIDWVLQNSNDLQAWSVVVDPLLLEEGKSNGTSDKQMQQVKLLIQVGLLCTQTNPHNRPRIYDVLAMLTHIRTLGEDPVDTPTLAELVEETTEAFPV